MTFLAASDKVVDADLRRHDGGGHAGGSAFRAPGIIVALLLAALMFGPHVAAAADTVAVTIRTGNHPGFGRVVFDASPRVSYQVVRDGDRLTVQFADNVDLTGDPKPPRNVAALHADHAQAVLTIAAGATFRNEWVGDHIVVDVFDPAPEGGDPAPVAGRLPPPATPPPAASKPHAAALSEHSAVAAAAGAPPPATSAALASAPPSPWPLLPPPPEQVPAAAVAPAPGQTPNGAVAPAPDQTPAASVAPAPDQTPAAAVAPVPEQTPDAAMASAPTGPIALVALPVAPPPDTSGAAFSVPFSGDVGAAVFRRGGETLAVFDERRPIDMAALQSSPAFAEARVELLPAGTLIRMKPPPGTTVTLTKTPQGWTIAALAIPPRQQPFAPELDGTSLSVVAQAPGRVLTIADPVTGGTLLVGTQLQPGQVMLTLHRTPQFALLPTAQGVVAAPLADTVALRAVPNGFALTTAPDPLAMSSADPDSVSDPAALTRRFAFPDLPETKLTRQLSAEIDGAAAVPLLARGPGRRAAATTMISLGMDAEAEALLQLAAADDPRQAASADVVGLTAVAAILAGRPAESDGIDDPRLTGSDEIELWRALHVALRDDTSQRAAAALASTAPLLLWYPPAMRDKVLPLAAETLVKGGDDAAAKDLLAQSKGLPGLGLARAMLAQASGDTDAALAQYDALTAGHDRLASARASVRAVELRLATGKFDTRQAAEALDRLLYSWRGDQRELDLRERLADLRQKLGEWRQALALLRNSETLFPDEARQIHARLQATFDAMLREDVADKLPPLEFVALVDENADLVPNTQAGLDMQATLADRLVALDLPDRAGPVLDKLMRAVPAGPSRAVFGVRLAKLRLGDGDAGGALAALTASDAPDLPAPLTLARVLVRAEAQARWGDVAGAISTLAGLDSVAADATRATILEEANDWMGADRALTDYVAKAVPETGDLDADARRLLLRLATAAARAGDETTLATLRERQEARMGTGALADMFRLLTADPVQNTADLARAGREVGYARALPADLQAMQPPVRTP